MTRLYCNTCRTTRYEYSVGEAPENWGKYWREAEAKWLDGGRVPFWLVREYLGERGRAQGYEDEQLGHWVNEEQNRLEVVDGRTSKERAKDDARITMVENAKTK